MGKELSSFKKLVVWKKSVDLATTVYALTSKFPRAEQYGLASQMQRAAVSVASNIAEGSGRASPREFAQFLQIAQGSACELETQLEIAHHVGLISDNEYATVSEHVVEVKMMLTSLSRTILR